MSTVTTQTEALRLLIEDLELNHEFCPKEVILHAAKELWRLYHNNLVLMDALWKVCGDDEEVVNATIESQGELL